MKPSTYAVSLISVLSLICIWALIAAFMPSRYLPSPAQVAFAWLQELRSGSLLYHLTVTLLRVAASFTIAMVIGTTIGLWLGRNPGADRFFDPWLIFALNIPALVTIVFCYLWIGITEAAAVAAVAINKIPNVAVTIREGAKSLDPALDDVARVFNFSVQKRLRKLIWPQLEPYLAAAVRGGLALIWKIVLVVELIGRSNGIGFQINLFFGLFDLSRILAYALSFMAVVWAIETLAIKPWQSRSRQWRGDA